MKLLYYYITGALLLLGACSEATREMFDTPPAVYFQMPQGDTTLIVREDTVVYSFAFDLTSTRREICIPVQLIGFAADRDRKYNIEITNIGDTRAGVHYEAVATEQTLAAGKTVDSLRVTFLRTPDMQQGAKKVAFTIRPGGDLAEGLRDQLHVAIQVSDILEQPEWWDTWSRYFGPYDRQIYEQWMTIWGGTGDLTNHTPGWGYSPQVHTAIIGLRVYFDEHEVYYLDNPSVRIILPNN